ncbi:MAG: hypothetical protein AAGG46_00235 [Planctomycetota bacterium]
MPRCFRVSGSCLAPLLVLTLIGNGRAIGEGSGAKPAAPADSASFDLAGGALSFEAPAAWKRVMARNRLIELELAVPGKPAADTPSGDAPTARLTIMAAGGSVDQNLARWIGQFQGTAAGAAREKADIDHREVAGMPLHTLDIAGTYMDAPRGPFGPKEARPDYRMAAAILETKGQGTYFFKLVGPGAVVEQNAKEFAAMLDSVEAK